MFTQILTLKVRFFIQQTLKSFKNNVCLVLVEILVIVIIGATGLKRLLENEESFFIFCYESLRVQFPSCVVLYITSQITDLSIFYTVLVLFFDYL